MNRETLQGLNRKVEHALATFKAEMRDLGVTSEYVDYGTSSLHENVKIIDGVTAYEIPQDKRQIVIVLVGEWTLTHGTVVRKLSPEDVVKIPAGSPFKVIMESKSEGAKFVYAQFR